MKKLLKRLLAYITERDRNAIDYIAAIWAGAAMASVPGVPGILIGMVFIAIMIIPSLALEALNRRINPDPFAVALDEAKKNPGQYVPVNFPGVEGLAQVMVTTKEDEDKA